MTQSYVTKVNAVFLLQILVTYVKNIFLNIHVLVYTHQIKCCLVLYKRLRDNSRNDDKKNNPSKKLSEYRASWEAFEGQEIQFANLVNSHIVYKNSSLYISKKVQILQQIN